MVSTFFSTRVFRLEILDYLSRGSVYFGHFPVGRAKIKLPYHFHSDRNLGVNGKQPSFTNGRTSVCQNTDMAAVMSCGNVISPSNFLPIFKHHIQRLW